jgi:hypothetical protein
MAPDSEHNRDLLRDILVALRKEQGVGPMRTDTTLLLDIKQDVAVIQTQVGSLLSERDVASKQREHIIDRISSLEQNRVTPQDMNDLRQQADRWRGAFWAIASLGGMAGVITALVAAWSAMHH